MFRISKKIQAVMLFTIFSVQYNAMAQSVSALPALKGGINRQQWRRCLESTAKQCSQQIGQTPSIPAFTQCNMPLMTKSKICVQNEVLFNFGNVFDIKQMQAYQQVQVIQATVLMADSSSRFYIISSLGEVIKLVEIPQTPLVKLNPKYSSLIKRYPQLSVWGLSNNFPRQVNGSKGINRLIFRQTLKNGCMACASPGTAEIAYDFAADGHYLGYKIIL